MTECCGNAWSLVLASSVTASGCGMSPHPSAPSNGREHDCAGRDSAADIDRQRRDTGGRAVFISDDGTTSTSAAMALSAQNWSIWAVASSSQTQIPLPTPASRRQ